MSRQKPKTNRAGDPSKSQIMDRCQTPPIAVKLLIPFLPKLYIWESACGKGRIVDTLRQHEFEVIGTDLLGGYNYFDYQPEFWQIQVTNPPYTVKYKWIERAYQFGKPWALLMPGETLFAKASQKMFNRYGMELIVFDARINFEMPNIGLEGSAATFPTAWFTHGLNIGKEITYVHVPRKGEEGQLPLL